MNKKWLLSSALCTVMGLSHADDNVLLNEQVTTPQPGSAEINQSLTVVGYSDSSLQIDDNTLSPVEPAMGVLVDYQPFDSNFNMSAANFQTQPSTTLNTPVVNRTYLGVGWKKLLDDAQNLGVRVDIGAVYDDKTEPAGKALNNSGSATPASSPAIWEPVISLGVSYRF